MVILETERLVLQKFSLADAPFILELVNSPKWLQFIGDRGIRNLSEAENYLQNGPIKSYAKNGFGLYLAKLKDTDAPIGMCGLIKREYLEDVDIGYALLPEYEGKGYAYESALATVQYASKELNASKLAAITDPENERSVKLLEKMGFVFKETITVDNNELLLLIKDSEL